MVTELAPGGSLEGHIAKAIKIKLLIASGEAEEDTKMPFDGVQMVKWALQIAAGKIAFVGYAPSPLSLGNPLLFSFSFLHRHGTHS
jgi:hypothetical protein